jgi:hypothetical protein
MKSILIFSVLTFSMLTFAQSDNSSPRFDGKSKNTIYAELLGNNLYYSLNFDRILWQKEHMFFSARIGASFVPAKRNHYSIGIPLEGNFLFGKTKHYLELGLGTQYMFASDYYFLTDQQGEVLEVVEQDIQSVRVGARIGYRYQNPGGGFFFRAGLTPYVKVVDIRKDKYDGQYAQPESQLSLIPWAGLSFGYSFK